MTFIKPAALTLLVMAFLSCARTEEKPKLTAQNGTPTPTALLPLDTPTTAPATPAPPVRDPKAKYGDASGTITKLNFKLGSVELKHGDIKGIMPAMQMEFYVKDKAMMDGLAVGEKVDFTLEEKGSDETIVSITKK
jgi:Cu/Ag efflux protein CusF